MKRQPLLLTLALLLIFVASTATAQNETQKYKVVLPEEEGWIAIPAEAAPGETVIIKYTGDKKVLDVEVHQIISLDKTNMSVYIGNTDQLAATTYPENQTVTWSSSDESVATVSASGVVTGVSAGTATITATFDESSESCEVTVEERPLLLSGVFSVSSTNKVKITRGNLQYNPKNNAWRFAQTQYDVCHQIDDNVGDDYAMWVENGKWTDLFGWGMWLDGENPVHTAGDDYNYLPTITSNGQNFTGISAIGTDYTTLTYDEWQYLVTNHTRTWRTINGVNGMIILPDGCTDVDAEWADLEAAGAMFLPAAGSRAIASVSLVGFDCYYWSATAYENNSSYNVSFAASGAMETYHFYRNFGLPVRLVRKVFSLDKTNMSVCIGNTDQLAATTYPENQTVTWSSSDESVATVSASGVVTGVSEGTATITATYDGCSESCEVTVKKKLSLNKNITSIYVGNTEQLTATTYPENQTVTWESSNESVATVNANGVVTGVSAGTATITATYDGSSESCVVTVKAVPEGFVNLGVTDAAGKSVFWAQNNLEGTYTWEDAKTAATNAVGELPTTADFVALVNACYWVYEQNMCGVYAYKLRDGETSNYSESSFNNDRNYSTATDPLYIFLPCTNPCSEWPDLGDGRYWSSIEYEDDTDEAECLYFFWEYVNPDNHIAPKTDAISVRLVWRSN